MGNCMASNKLVSENDMKQQQLLPSLSMKNTKTSHSKRDEEEGSVKKKMVTFKLSDNQTKVDGEGGGGGGAVRVRVVVTKEELRQILKHRKDLKCDSLEELVRSLRLRERWRHEGRCRDDNEGSWKPALESIPEDHS